MSATRLDTDETLGSFAELVAAGTAAPGGGSVAAHCGMMAAALGRMVCNLTIGKPKFELRDAMTEARESVRNPAAASRLKPRRREIEAGLRQCSPGRRMSRRRQGAGFNRHQRRSERSLEPERSFEG